MNRKAACWLLCFCLTDHVTLCLLFGDREIFSYVEFEIVYPERLENYKWIVTVYNKTPDSLDMIKIPKKPKIEIFMIPSNIMLLKEDLEIK